MRKRQQVTAFVVAAILFCCTGALMIGGSGQVGAKTSVGEKQPENPVYHADTDATDWSYVYFGEYPQTEVTGEALTDDIRYALYDEMGEAVIDGVRYKHLESSGANYMSKVGNGSFYNWYGRDEAFFRYEPIRWRVLQNDGESLFLLADSVLDCCTYQRDDHAVTWSIAFLRNWLNGYYPCENSAFNFIDRAFTKQEQEAILTTEVKDSDNVLHGTSGGPATQDKLFLLSIKEATNTKYGFPSDFMEYSSTRRMKPSNYAYARGVWLSTYNKPFDGNCWWLLRSPGNYQQAVSMVYRWGNVYQDGYYATEKYYGTCPAMRIDIHSPLWKPAEFEQSVQSSIQSVTYGDYNEDGKVTLVDAYFALKAVHGISGNLDRIEDLDGNNKVNLADVQLVLKMALGIINEFPVEKVTMPTETPKPAVTPQPVTTTPPAITPVPTPIVTTPPVTQKPTNTPKPSEIPKPSATPEPLVQQHYGATGTVWLAADSIAASHPKSGTQPLYGWGELFGGYFTGEVEVHNTALGSRSTKSYTSEDNYRTIRNTMTKGDYLLISFGHNDERPVLNLYTDPYGTSDVAGSFKWYLKNNYIDPAVRAGVTPVLISPIVRRFFLNGEFVKPLHTQYATAMKELTEEYAAQGITVGYIDLHHKFYSLYEQLGETGTIALHGLSGNVSDNTHLCMEGAKKACEYIIEGMKQQNMDLCDFLKE